VRTRRVPALQPGGDEVRHETCRFSGKRSTMQAHDGAGRKPGRREARKLHGSARAEKIPFSNELSLSMGTALSAGCST